MLLIVVVGGVIVRRCFGGAVCKITMIYAPVLLQTFALCADQFESEIKRNETKRDHDDTNAFARCASSALGSRVSCKPPAFGHRKEISSAR